MQLLPNGGPEWIWSGQTYRSGGALEHGHLAGGALPLLGRDDGLEDLGGDVPQLLVLGAEEDDDAVGLGVEGGGHLLQEGLDDLLDLVGLDGEVLGQRVVRPAVLGELDQLLGGGHLDGRGGGEGAEEWWGCCCPAGCE